ncbi:YtcA family lipoprotein [Paraburkholderia aspalathi]|uniref:YtcA family lipoprotein n=1 Tax=Paraburkholderia aspalathi TaxID=1324617 RepID=UPI0038BB53BD
MSSGVRRRRHGWTVLMSCAALTLTACSDAPSIGVLGAYFPDWLFCIVGGVLLVVCVHVLLSRSGRGAWLTPPAIVYPALTVLFSIALWVAGFNL